MAENSIQAILFPMGGIALEKKKADTIFKIMPFYTL
jgi:hypothetical protein